ncbi:MAG: ABC transporter permease [Oscillospiraceae bacterium]|nr:ABC transporter permease [Oscillospiraceae bacterium]
MNDIIRCSIKSLLRKRLRTLLTVGSITIGVMLVVVVTMISNAGKKAVNSELENLGISGLSISTANSLTSGGLYGISYDNLELIRKTENVTTAMPLMIHYASSLLRESRFDTLICGIDAGAKQAISLNLKYGRMISRGDVGAVDNVCVVDETLAKQSYGRENITGKSIYLQINGVEEEFKIIGVSKAGSSLMQNLVEFIPSMVYVPYSTLQTLTGRDNFDQVAIRVSGHADIAKTENEILERLRRSTGFSDYFRADNLSLQRDKLGGLLDIVSIVLTVISSISLIVSGLGIMTIMLVSVNERMREIGIKKAIGASGKRIMLEFLTEAVVISFFGSVTGIIVGGTLSFIGIKMFGLSVPVKISDFVILIAFSVVIGGVFGVYPAVKASRLKPVDALRME